MVSFIISMMDSRALRQLIDFSEFCEITHVYRICGATYFLLLTFKKCCYSKTKPALQGDYMKVINLKLYHRY